MAGSGRNLNGGGDVQQGGLIGDRGTGSPKKEVRDRDRRMSHPEGGRMKHKIPEEVLREIFQRKIKRRDLNGEIYNKLKKMILSGKFKKGERLIQEELAHGFDVSRTVVLNAFAQLEKDKLIVRKYREGAFVSSKP